MLGLIFRFLPAPLRALILAVVGGVLIWGGIRLWTGPARCGSQTMSAGQLCQDSKGTSRTVAQVLDSQHTHGWFPFITGLVLLLAAVMVLTWSRRTWR